MSTVVFEKSKSLLIKGYWQSIYPGLVKRAFACLFVAYQCFLENSSLENWPDTFERARARKYVELVETN